MNPSMFRRLLPLLVLSITAACVVRAEPRYGMVGQPECQMSTNGQQVCGYNCQMGADGQVACANTPDGVCEMGADGHVVCSQAVVAMAPQMGGPPPECRMGADGQQVCGYGCRLGSDGHFYCSSVPGGECALNSDGSFSCP